MKICHDLVSMTQILEEPAHEPLKEKETQQTNHFLEGH